MPRRLALVVESDTALRSLLAQVLRGVDWEVQGCSSVGSLQTSLALSVGSQTERLLIVSSTLLLSACAGDVVDVARAREHDGQGTVQVLVTCELGELGATLPSLDPAELIGTLEKPFDIDVFEALVTSSVRGEPRGCSRARSAAGASSPPPRESHGSNAD